MLVVFFSCKKDTSPLGKYVSVQYSGKIVSVTHEFRISNDSMMRNAFSTDFKLSPAFLFMPGLPTKQYSDIIFIKIYKIALSNVLKNRHKPLHHQLPVSSREF